MNEEEKEAIYEIEDIRFDERTNRKIEIILNLIEKQQKVIDLMAFELAIPGKSIELINLYNQVHPDKLIDNVIKEYFYKKAEEENE